MKLSSQFSTSLFILVGTLVSAAIVSAAMLLAPDETDSIHTTEASTSIKSTPEESQPRKKITPQERRKDFWGIYQKPEANPPSKGLNSSTKIAPAKQDETQPASEKKSKEVFGIREWTRERPSRLEKEFNKSSDNEEETDTLWSHRSKRQPKPKTGNSVVDRFLDKAFPEASNKDQRDADAQNNQNRQEEAFEIITLKRRKPYVEGEVTGKQSDQIISSIENTQAPGDDIPWNNSPPRQGPHTLYQSTQHWLKAFRSNNDWDLQRLVSRNWESLKNDREFINPQKKTTFTVKTAYIDVYSTPGQYHPIFHTLERDSQVTLMNAKFGWYQVETPQGKRGWINGNALLNNFSSPNQALIPVSKQHGDRYKGPWSIGITAGAFEQESYLQLLFDRPLTQQLALQAVIGAITDPLSNAYLVQAGIKQSLFNHNSFYSYSTAHLGFFDNQPSQRSLSSKTIKGPLLSMGLGVELPLTSYLSVTTEAKQHLAFINSNQVEPYQSLTAGVTFKHDNALHHQIEKHLNHRIDQDNNHIGLYSGLYSADHLDASLVYGIYFAQHINDKLQLVLNWAQTDLSTQALSGLLSLKADSTQTLQYMAAQGEYSLFQGEILTGRTQQMVNLYVSTGVGITDFQQHNYFTLLVGSGVNINFNDWLSVNTGLRTHVLEDNRFGKSQTSYNIEFSSGINLAF